LFVVLNMNQFMFDYTDGEYPFPIFQLSYQVKGLHQCMLL
jgi:hypothetical protein